MSKNSFIDYIPPVLIFILVAYSFFSYVVLYCIYVVQSPMKKYSYIAVYHVLVIMFLWSYCNAVFYEHAAIPYEYCLSLNDHLRLVAMPQPDLDMMLKKIVMYRKLEIHSCTDMGQIRYCRECHLIKPDRTHHCSTCEQCILKMDHHCPWMVNCIGFGNYKQFVLGLLYALLWSLFCASTMVEFLLDFWKIFAFDDWMKLVIGIGFIMFAFTAMLVLVLFIYHTLLLFRNATTLEDMREVSFTQANLTYNVGRWNNFVQVFGNDICLWLLPVFSALGNGYEFPVAYAR